MRDYVFLSLGGVFKGYRRAAINVLVVFLIIGIWHGATWTYVMFGLLHGTFLILETILQRSRVRRLRLWKTILGVATLWALTMALCCLAFVLYRAKDLGQAWEMLNAMVGLVRTPFPSLVSEFDALVVALILESIIIVHWLRRRLSLHQVIARSPWWLIAFCLAGMLFLITIISGDSHAFLYFQF